MRMVQGLNWNNYSPAQIVEMKNNGIDVPEKVYKEAEAALSEQDAKEVTAEHGDASKLNYSIVDSASDKNEAKEMREQLEAEGMKLKDMVKMFTDQSNTASTTLIESMKQIDEYVSYIEVEEQQAQELSDAAEDAEQVIVQIAADTEEKVDAKADELAFLNEEIEAGTATEDDIAKAEDLSTEIKETSEDGASKIADKSSDAAEISSQVAAVDSNLKEVAQNIGKAYNKAIDGQELATETMDMSNKLMKKGKTIQTIAMAIGGVAGGVGGAFAGRAAGGAIADSINDKKFNQFLQQNGLTATHTYESEIASSVQEAGYGSSIAYENGRGEIFTKDEINKEINAEKRSKNWDIGGTIGGAALGGGIGVAVGSLFGRSKIEAAQNGINAAAKLTAVSTQTKAIAEKVAEQNDISIKTAGAADDTAAEATTLADAVKDKLEGNGAPQIAKPQDTTAAPSTEPTAEDEDPNKPKKEIV